MQLEFGNKNREFESLRSAYDKVCADNQALAEQLDQKDTDGAEMRRNAEED
jgi:hypothetical protein